MNENAIETSNAEAAADEAQWLGYATYSPEDNKIRFTPNARLSPEEYERAKKAGFAWAPRQKIFVCPAWRPAAEDLMIEWCGEIGDEGTSLADRAAERAERFEEHAENRARDAIQAEKAVERISDGIPLGQPILVGHHSERHARRDAKRIQDSMNRAVANWKTSEYWEQRAAAAKRHADYKADPGVRMRRIRGLEADLRKMEKRAQQRADAAKLLEKASKLAEVNEAIVERVLGMIWSAIGDHFKEGRAAEDKRAFMAGLAERYAKPSEHTTRWADHYRARIVFERAMLQDQNALVLDAEKWDIVPGGRVFARDEWWTVTKVTRGAEKKIRSVTAANEKRKTILSVELLKEYEAPSAEAAILAKVASKIGPIVNLKTEGCRTMTKREWDELSKGGMGFWVEKIDATEEHGAYRIRRWHHFAKGYERVVTDVFIEDIKETPIPKPNGIDTAAAKKALREAAGAGKEPSPPPRMWNPAEEPGAAARARAEALQAVGKVEAVVADQLFPTPPAVCEEIKDAIFHWASTSWKPRTIGAETPLRILEPSVGTWNLVEAARDALQEAVPEQRIAHLVTVEINQKVFETGRNACAQKIDPEWTTRCINEDFLEMELEDIEPFDLIVMNPPFKNGIDMKHMNRARLLLKPQGLLVAVCAGGPRQEQFLRDAAATWRRLPEGSFAPATNVSTIIATMRGSIA